MRVSAGVRLRHHPTKTGDRKTSPKNPRNLRYSGCHLPTKCHPTGNCAPMWRNRRCALAQEQRERAEELRHGQKLHRALREPPANQVCPA